MKKIIIKVLISLLFLTFFSCSQPTPVKLITNQDETLRSIIQEKESTINWTKTLEDSVLSTKIDSFEGISSNIKLSPEVLRAYNNTCAPVIPYLEDFVSLDINNLGPGHKTSAIQLINTINSNFSVFPETIINAKFLFNYIFFKNDFIEEWNQNFQTEFKENCIKKYLFGEPFSSEDLIQIPVRLFSEYGYVDIEINFINDEKNLISQIEITKWEKKDVIR